MVAPAALNLGPQAKSQGESSQRSSRDFLSWSVGSGSLRGSRRALMGVPKGVFQAGFEAGIEAPHAALVGKYRNR